MPWAPARRLRSTSNNLNRYRFRWRIKRPPARATATAKPCDTLWRHRTVYLSMEQRGKYQHRRQTWARQTRRHGNRRQWLSATATTEVTENILAMTVALTEKIAIKCAGEKAALALKVSGGKPPFNYNWNNPALSGEAPAALDGGDYA